MDMILPPGEMVAAASPRAGDLVAGLEKGLAVIEAFGREGRRLSISEVAAHTGLTRAAARRYLLTLSKLGYAINDGKAFSLTPQVLSLGLSYLQSARLPRVIQPALERLSSSLQEASEASVLQHDEVVAIAAAGIARGASATVQPGRRLPARSTSEGRVLAAALPDADLAAWAARQTTTALAPPTVAQPDALHAELLRVRADGHAVADRDGAPGWRSISVPLRNFSGATVAAMTVSAHGSRLGAREMVVRCLPALLAAQEQLKPLL